MLVRFDGPASSQRCLGFQFYIEDLPRRPADLVTSKALCKEPRTLVETGGHRCLRKGTKGGTGGSTFRT